MAIAAAVNVVLDILLVGPLNMGAAGAAWATISAQAISFIISVVFLRRRDFVFDFHPRSFRIHRDLAGKLIKIGLPASLQGTLVSFSFMVLTGIANVVAVSPLVGSTALSIAGKVNSIAILPSMAMQASVSSMVGQNMGAGKPERAKKTMWVAVGFAFSVSALVFALVNLFPEQIVALFLGSQEQAGMTAEVLAQCVEQSAPVSADDQLRLPAHQRPFLHNRPGHGGGTDPILHVQRHRQFPAAADSRRLYFRQRPGLGAEGRGAGRARRHRRRPCHLLHLSAHRRLEAGQGGASRSGGGMILHFPPAARIIKAV